jgi:hypothetical protein
MAFMPEVGKNISSNVEQECWPNNQVSLEAPGQRKRRKGSSIFTQAWLLPRRYRKAHGYNSAYASSIIPKPTAQKWMVGKVMFFPKQVKQTTSDASYFECFRSSNLRRTGIANAPYCIQTLSGIYFASN